MPIAHSSGHWEGDLLILERALENANVTSLVERKSGYTVLIKNGNRHSQPIIDEIGDTFAPLPVFTVRVSPSTAVPGCAASGLWKTGSVPGAGFAIRIHRGKNVNKRIGRFMRVDTDLSAVSQPSGNPSFTCVALALDSSRRKACD